MLLAVLETRCGIRLHDKEIYLSVAGGMRVIEPAADLAVAAALLSAMSDIPTPMDAIYFGELGLSGEIRRVSRADQRLKEAEKLGFKQAFFPPSSLKKENGLQSHSLSHIQELAMPFLRENKKRG
jgi:DNA repair protein RadA/Sms